MKRFISITLFLVMLASPVFAGKKPAPPAYPPAAEQQSFTERYWQAVDGGAKALKQFSDDVTNHGTMDEVRMMSNLENGKAADGTEAKGFRGDPNDPGPQDWSDWNIETDANGNVSGFKEKDFEQKDTDGDGEISDAERKAWDKKKKEEDDARGGPPGHVHRPPDWDKNEDGKPDPGFELDCYQCKQPPMTAMDEADQCHGNEVGPCDSHSCPENEKCEEYTETGKNYSYICHSCNEKDSCELKGFCSDPKCNGQCPPITCVPIDVDKKTGQIIPTNQTRARDSTERCYTCMKVKWVEVTWIVVIVETPYGRFVLDKDKGSSSGFNPTSIMALAKVDKASGMIQNTMGELKSIQSFLGGFGVGIGPMGITSTGKVSMDQLSSLLAQNLKSGGSFGADCFGNVVDEADKDAASSGTLTSTDINGTSTERKKDKARRESETTTEADLKTADASGPPAVSGPIVACGNDGRNKVLKIYDASGAVVDTITQSMLKLNPDIITEKLGIAQQATDFFLQKSGFDFAGYVEKFTGLPLRQIQSVAAQVAQAKAQLDQVVDKAAKSKKKKKEEPMMIPNDPLYKLSDTARKKAEVKSSTTQVVLGSLMKIGDSTLGAGSNYVDEKKESEIKDQYGIRVVGYTPYTDPDSAWNVVDANQKNVVVAIVDSGLDMTHEDAPQYIWTNPKEIPDNKIDDDKDGFVDDVHGWNFLNENQDFTDVRGHGTFVAGIIAAKQNNGLGIAGINPGAVIMPIKVADDEGETNSLNIYRGINYAVDHGAKIINVSLGGRSISSLEQEAVERAGSLGALVVMAAGNNGEDLMTFGPSSSKQALSVGQVDYSGVRSTVSNWGANLGVLAPGEKIYSLCSKDNKHVLPSIRKAGYYQQDGTSFSTPMVTATASLLLARDPSLTNRQIADIILSTATDMDEKGWDGMTGAGLLNASAALRAQASNKLFVLFTNIRFNRNVEDKLVSVDVFGTVNGEFREFTLEVGKGKNARSFNPVAGPFNQPYRSQFIARLPVKEFLRGSNDWIFRLRVIDQSGQEHIATTPFAFPK